MEQLLATDCSVLSREELLVACRSRVSPERWEKAAQLSRPADRWRSLAAGVLLTALCGAVPVLTVSASGKPDLDDGGHISLSHSGKWAVAALSALPVGVDVQECRSVSIRRCCSPAEAAFLDRQADPAAAAMRLWTRKESYAKLTGEGFPALSCEQQPEETEDMRLGCRFTDYWLPDGTPVTLCTALSVHPPELRRVDLADLLR